MPTLEEQFRENALALNRKTMHLSMIKEQYPEYQAILAMGLKALPFLLQDVRDRREDAPLWHWFRLLYRITGEWPAEEKYAGMFDKTADAWVEWAERKGIKLSDTPTPLEVNKMAH